MLIAEQGKEFVIHADNLVELQHYTENTPRRWRGFYSRSNRARPEWDLNEGWHGACRLARDGWSQGARQIETGEVDVNAMDNIKQMVYDFAGHQPDVARFCSGDPRHMMHKRRAEAVTTHLVVNLWASGGTSANTFMQYGRGVLALIDQLENSGHRVELDVIFPTAPRGGYMVCGGWKVKRASDPLDAAAIAFSIAHPAALRRFGFALIEYAPLMADDDGGYGHQTELTPWMTEVLDLGSAHILPGIGIAHGMTANDVNKTLRHSMSKVGVDVRMEGEV